MRSHASSIRPMRGAAWLVQLTFGRLWEPSAPVPVMVPNYNSNATTIAVGMIPYGVAVTGLLIARRRTDGAAVVL